MRISGLKTKSFEFLSLGCFLILLIYLFSQQGILKDKEALKYLGAADQILQGNFKDFFGRYRLYSGYILFLLPFKALKIEFLAIFTQIALHVYAAFKLKKVILLETKHIWSANLGMFLYLTAYPIHQWTLSYYSEGLFIPLSTIVICSTLPSWQRIFKLLYLILVRPTGFFFSGLKIMLERLRYRWVFLVLPVFVIALLLLPIFPKDQIQGMMVHPIVLVDHNDQNQVDLDKKAENLWAVQERLFVDQGMTGLVSTYTMRSISLFNPCRPWFSVPHNLLVSFYFLLYPLVLFGLWKNQTKFTQTLGAILLYHMVLIALTYDNYNARYFATILPSIIILGCLGFSKLPFDLKRNLG